MLKQEIWEFQLYSFILKIIWANWELFVILFLFCLKLNVKLLTFSWKGCYWYLILRAMVLHVQFTLDSKGILIVICRKRKMVQQLRTLACLPEDLVQFLAQSSVTPVPEDSDTSSDLCGHRMQVGHRHTCRQNFSYIKHNTFYNMILVYNHILREVELAWQENSIIPVLGERIGEEQKFKDSLGCIILCLIIEMKSQRMNLGSYSLWFRMQIQQSSPYFRNRFHAHNWLSPFWS